MWIIIDLTEPEMISVVMNDEGWTMFFDSEAEADDYATKSVAGDYKVVELDA